MIRSGHAAPRSPGSRRATLAVAAAVLTGVIACGVSVSRASASGIPVGQALVILLHNKVVHSAPSPSAPEMTTVAARRPLTRVRTVLPVLASATKHDGSWVDVRLPGRPNSSSGWITTTATMPSWTPWRLSVDLASRVLTVYDRGRVARRFPAVVGKPSTPTPTGQFFIEEALSLNGHALGAPFALASSARSDALRSYDGGPGQVAIHGMGNLPGALGTASSHGCVRLDTTDITWLAMHIGSGVPLSIRS